MSKKNEVPQPESFEKRVAKCPIHQWANIDTYLQEAMVPKGLHKTFHELVLLRGQFGKNIKDDEAKKFGVSAVSLMKESAVTALDAQAMRIIFVQLVNQWLAVGAENN